ncbi:MAG: hypothetical protein CSB34_06270 [Desulfobulbus propionicus]|nr:MAG: hypothetical protein CSB34_06270 [Desulfobulbus propionicus]
MDNIQVENTKLRAELEILLTQNQILEEQVKKADSASKAKSDFLAMISHEIRTPMNGVIGLSKLLLNTDMEPRQKHFAELIHGSAESLLALINSLLDFSKIEADKLILEETFFQLRPLLDDLVTIYAVTARQKNIGLQLTYDDNLAASYKGDSYRLRQILVNLIGNAIKFTEQGQISVTVSKKGEQDGKDNLRCSVRDTGIGIDPEAVPYLFQPFVQADATSTRKFGGTGLGLSICAKLVKLMGGEIGAELTADGGSEFWFTLALERSEDVGTEPVNTPQAMKQLSLPVYKNPLKAYKTQQQKKQHIRILVADDDSTNRIVMQELFRTLHLTLDVTSNGAMAVALCKKHEYDLIFMDCQMPVMDGFEATKKILKYHKAQPGAYVPLIVALTADATTTTRKRCYDIGMIDYLVKPIDFEQMEQVLNARFPQLGVTHLSGKGESDSGGDLQPVLQDKDLSSINPAALQRLEKHVGSTNRVIQVFVPAMQKRVAEMAQAAKEQRIADVQKIAHTMKGSSAQIGAEELSALCAQVEQAGKLGNSGHVDQLLPKIMTAVDDVIAFFQEQLDKT